MKRFFILLLFNTLILNIIAQSNDFNCIDTSVIQSFEAKLTSVVINPGAKFNDKCLTRDWCLSSVLLYNNELIKNKYLKYNGFDDSFIWLENVNLKQTRLEKEFIMEVVMKTNPNIDSMHFRQMKIKKAISTDSSSVFLNVLFEGKISLYVFRQIRYYGNSDSYKPDFIFYLKNTDGFMYRFKPNRFRLLEQFPARKKALRKIIRKNSLVIREEKDLVKAIKLLNSEI